MVGGVPSINTRDNTPNSAAFSVVRAGVKGEILELHITNRGKYITAPNHSASIKGGSGNGATIEADYKLCDYRSFIERDIEKIEFKSSETIMSLLYPLPEGIKAGKFSVDKWEIVLTSNYHGESKNNAAFQVIRDFTPNYGVPLLAQNAANQELIFNHTITFLDGKIKELEERIVKLEKAKSN